MFMFKAQAKRFGNIRRVIERQQQYAYFESFVFNLPLINARGASIVALRLVGSRVAHFLAGKQETGNKVPGNFLQE